MTRFRPSVVISGVEAWAEDDWRLIRIGEAVFRAVKGCARCVITTVDPDTGGREKEPIVSGQDATVGRGHLVRDQHGAGHLRRDDPGR